MGFVQLIDGSSDGWLTVAERAQLPPQHQAHVPAADSPGGTARRAHHLARHRVDAEEGPRPAPFAGDIRIEWPATCPPGPQQPARYESASRAEHQVASARVHAVAARHGIELLRTAIIECHRHAVRRLGQRADCHPAAQLGAPAVQVTGPDPTDIPAICLSRPGGGAERLPAQAEKLGHNLRVDQGPQGPPPLSGA